MPYHLYGVVLFIPSYMGFYRLHNDTYVYMVQKMLTFSCFLTLNFICSRCEEAFSVIAYMILSTLQYY